MTIYVIGQKELFDQRFADYQNGVGHYFEVGFKNWGAIRHSLDGQFTLLEETEDKFDPADLEAEGVIVFRSDEAWSAAKKCLNYINYETRKQNWNPPDEF